MIDHIYASLFFCNSDKTDSNQYFLNISVTIYCRAIFRRSGAIGSWKNVYSMIAFRNIAESFTLLFCSNGKINHQNQYYEPYQSYEAKRLLLITWHRKLTFTLFMKHKLKKKFKRKEWEDMMCWYFKFLFSWEHRQTSLRIPNMNFCTTMWQTKKTQALIHQYLVA